MWFMRSKHSSILPQAHSNSRTLLHLSSAMASATDNRIPWQKVKMRASRLKKDAKSGLNQYNKEISDEKRIECVQQLKELADKYRVPEGFLAEVQITENDVRAGIRHASERNFGTKVKEDVKEEVK